MGVLNEKRFKETSAATTVKGGRQNKRKIRNKKSKKRNKKNNQKRGKTNKRK